MDGGRGVTVKEAVRSTSCSSVSSSPGSFTPKTEETTLSGLCLYYLVSDCPLSKENPGGIST